MFKSLIKTSRFKLLSSIVLALLSSCSNSAEQKNQDRKPLVLNGTSSTFGLQAYLRWFNQLAVNEDIYAEIESMGSGKSISTLLSKLDSKLFKRNIFVENGKKISIEK